MPNCGLCSDFQRSPRQFRFMFDCSQAELTRSANTGFVRCSFLLEGFRHFEPALEGPKDYRRIYIWGENIDGGCSVEMEVFSDGALKLRLEFFVTKGKSSPLEGAKMLPTIPGDTRAWASINWARQHLQQCVDSHESCGRRVIPELPSRVLEIGADREGRGKVRLIEAQGTEAQYACLSHRWSRPADLETKQSNLASHENGIEWALLSKTFKDAILVALDLGLRYIWIDSLCIIQDDVDDKWRELAKMSSIYANSHITIAATRSDGGSQGCYSEATLYHQDHRLSAKQPDGTMATTDLHVRRKVTHIGEQDAVTPLLKRGWVCQERLLSPRVLHFCEKELIWECQESSICQYSCYNPPIRLKEEYSELLHHSGLVGSSTDTTTASGVGVNDVTSAGPDTASSEKASDVEGLDDDKDSDYPYSSPFRAQRDDSDPVYKRRFPYRADSGKRPKRLVVYDARLMHSDFESRSSSTPVPRDEAILGWRQILSDYSGMDLTKHSDRLPAIAGVARQFGELMNSRYLAGLWETRLPSDLLWRTDHILEAGQHRLQYRSPSWSWASIDWKSKYYDTRSNSKAFSIVRASCDPVTDVVPFGEVKSGVLEVNASTAELSFTLDLCEDMTQSRRRIKVEFMENRAVFIPDYDISAGTAAKNAITHESHRVEYNFLCIGDFNIERDDAALSESQRGESLAVSLVFQRVDGSKYERVGILERTRGRYQKVSDTLMPTSRNCNLWNREIKNYKKEAWVFKRGLELI